MINPLAVILHPASGPDVTLRYVQIPAREFSYGLESSRAVESDTPQTSGDGKRDPAPIELEVMLSTPQASLFDRARALRDFEATLASLIEVRIKDLKTNEVGTFPVDRAVEARRVRVGLRYRLTLRLYGPQNEFLDAAGNPIPLV